MAHVLPVRGKEVRFILGKVKFSKKNPSEFLVKVVKPGEPKVIVGRRGVYVLDDELSKELIRRTWERLLGSYRPRKDGNEIVTKPIELTEEELREFLKEKGEKVLPSRGAIVFAEESAWAL